MVVYYVEEVKQENKNKKNWNRRVLDSESRLGLSHSVYDYVSF